MNMNVVTSMRVLNYATSRINLAIKISNDTLVLALCYTCHCNSILDNIAYVLV